MGAKPIAWSRAWWKRASRSGPGFRHDLDGEQQRVAIARALATGPELIIADEPAGPLGSGTGAQIIGLLRQAAWERGMAMLIATHDPAIAAEAGVLWKMAEGRLSPG